MPILSQTSNLLPCKFFSCNFSMQSFQDLLVQTITLLERNMHLICYSHLALVVSSLRCVLCTVYSQTGNSSTRIVGAVCTHSILGELIILVELTGIPCVSHVHFIRTDPAPNHIRVVLKAKHAPES